MYDYEGPDTRSGLQRGLKVWVYKVYGQTEGKKKVQGVREVKDAKGDFGKRGGYEGDTVMISVRRCGKILP